MAARDATRERNESGLRTFIESLKSLFNQLSRFNEGLQSIDEETLETFKRRLEDAAINLRLLVDHVGQFRARTIRPRIGKYRACGH